MKKIILIGGGGHCRSVIDVLECAGTFEVAGIVDIPSKRNTVINGYPVIGSDADLPQLVKDYKNFFITLGFVKRPNKRIQLYTILKELNAQLPVIISPRAYVSSRAQIAPGTIVMHDAILNTNVRIGPNSIVNSRALIEHDTHIGAHCHISTASVLNGGCIVGNNVLIGSASVVKQEINICDNCIVGMGSLVRKPLMEPGTYAGSPLKRLDERP